MVADQNIAPVLMHRPVQAFTLLYLLARDVRRPGDRVTRATLGDASFQGQDPAEQRRGVRQRLADLRRKLPPELKRRLQIDAEYVGFDTDGCYLDVRWLFDVADALKAAAGGELPDQLCQDARQALALAAQEFLPGWEEVDRRGSNGRSGANEIIAEARQMVEDAHLDLLAGLADAALARRQVDRAIAYLEEALQVRPERAALARRLADLYGQNGLRQRAAQLRAEYGLDEAS
jgi:DNA-binding SARP family transcriptional activator